MWKLFWLAALVLLAVLGTTDSDRSARRGKGNIWAVLVAGSSGYYNYRHQADVCHSYQVLHSHGVPDSQIVVMMYDDIANNPDNPDKGVIINKPGGPNVYTNVPKDYTGENVTPENFLHVLTGNKTALEGKGSGKVLQSAPHDHVFIFFSDHGGSGFIMFPNDGTLYSDDLIKAFKTMHKKKMYKKLVFYLEASLSGSMFDNVLPNNINILATTASNPTESSYACYWDEHLGTYIGDEFSCAWMEDVESSDQKGIFKKETLYIQYQNVCKGVTRSHPQMYGKMKLKKDHLKDYIGMGKGKMVSIDEGELIQKEFQDSVPSPNVPIHIIQNKIQMTDNAPEKQLLQMKLGELIEGRKTIDALFKSIVSHVTTLTDGDVTVVENEHLSLTAEATPCYKTVVESFRQNCVSFKNSYTLTHLYKLANLCVNQYSTDDIIQAFTASCNEHYRRLTGIY